MKSLSKEINDANFIHLSADCVGEGLLATGQRNYELAKQMTKQQSIEFLKWATDNYDLDVDVWIEIDTGIGAEYSEYTYDQLYELFEQHKSKQP